MQAGKTIISKKSRGFEKAGKKKSTESSTHSQEKNVNSLDNGGGEKDSLDYMQQETHDFKRSRKGTQKFD